MAVTFTVPTNQRTIGVAALGSLVAILLLAHASGHVSSISLAGTSASVSGWFMRHRVLVPKARVSSEPISYSHAVITGPLYGTRMPVGAETYFLVQTADEGGNVSRRDAIEGDKEPMYVAVSENRDDGSERQRLEGERIDWGTWRFNISMWTPGKHTVTVYAEGDYLYYGSSFADLQKSGRDHFDWPPKLVPAATMILSATKSRSGTRALAQRVRSLPLCKTDPDTRLHGRWLNPHVAFDRDGDIRELLTGVGEHESMDPHLGRSEAQGRNWVYVPDECRIPYRRSQEARDCLKGKRVSFVGDSLVEEMTADLGMLALGVDQRPNFDRFLGMSVTCGQYNQRMRMIRWPVRESVPEVVAHLAPPPAEGEEVLSEEERAAKAAEAQRMLEDLESLDLDIDMIWGAHQILCGNSEGLPSFGWPDGGMYRRIHIALTDPDRLKELPMHAWDTPADDDLPGAKIRDPDTNKWVHKQGEVIPESVKTDILVVDAGLHDMAQFRDKNMDLNSWSTRLETYLMDTGAFAKRKFLHLMNAKHPYTNVVVREMNDIARAHAKKYGFDVLDTYSMQEGRLTTDLHVLAGDFHHSSRVIYEGSRTPYLHAHTQLLLGNICDVE